jgi:hypothetical protein
MAMLAGCGVETSQQVSHAARGSEVGCDGGPFPAGWRGRDSVAVSALGLPWVRQHAEQPASSFEPVAVALRRLLRDRTLSPRQRREARAALRAAAPGAHAVAGTAVVVEAGHTATLSVPAEFRGRISLSYTRQSHDRERPPAWGALRVADGDHTVTFRACRDRETHWIGGFVVAGAQCAPLDIIVDGLKTRRNLAFGVPRETCPPPAGLSAVSFPAVPGWHVRVSGRGQEAPCLLDRVSWASTVALRDGEFDLPPQRTLATLPPDGIVIALYQFDNACLPSRPRTLPERSLPLRLDQAHESDFPGARGMELPLMRLAGRLPGRYDFDLWVFYGRRSPTPDQQRAAQAMLDRARWPERLR